MSLCWAKHHGQSVISQLGQEDPESWLGYSTLIQPLTKCPAQAGFEGPHVFSQLLKVLPFSSKQKLCTEPLYNVFCAQGICC